MRALFTRGAFTAADAQAAGATLAAYTVGLLPFVLIRSLTASFFARGDTATPVKALIVSVAVNVALKVILMGDFAQVGLAFATAVGAWVNFVLVIWYASRAGFLVVDQRLMRAGFKLSGAGIVLALALAAGVRWLAPVAASVPALRDEILLALLGIVGLIAYGCTVLALFGRGWLAMVRRRRDSPPRAR
jgi:putative peptidoglycan lipid II flippase